ncbi:MAG: hypothetical protein ACRC5T_10795 [Cetobacterium sp.]
MNITLPVVPGTTIKFEYRGNTVTAILDSRGYWNVPAKGKTSFLPQNLIVIYAITEYQIDETHD